ncbi:hypothetical protein CEUSTIGMA_g6609.t1 [Chlamydomonas eustigma]|uniref:Uncharacterized protein n=1 Tax=Chlamydomonas eustigma TaxID=1157962 RepID=A0A250X8B6_9CHLO|nr:hypothetical protein CEUSTIGMA_g6609.t1 [Chlamydomonas eustigma]|eukprot:GAX79169.1 hypothetical protein CEUSTIGMA_g6609.t1 [Chlamydomonas eustigma]
MYDKSADASFEADWGTLVALVLVIIIGALATTAGVGGGAIFVPLFQALVGFSLKDSTALSQALITAGFLVSVIINFFSPNPLDPTKPLIHFHFVLLLAPMLLVGVGIGVLLNYILPNFVISMTIFLLLSMVVSQNLAKGVTTWRAETVKKEQQKMELKEVGSAAIVAEAHQVSIDQIDQAEKGSHPPSGAAIEKAQDGMFDEHASILLQKEQGQAAEGPLFLPEAEVNVQQFGHSRHRHKEDSDERTLHIFVAEIECGKADGHETASHHPKRVSSGSITCAPSSQPLQHQLKAFIKQSWDRTPHQLLYILGVCWLAYFALQMAHSTCKVCSPTYWGTFSAQIVLMLLFCLVVANWFSKNFLPPARAAASPPNLLDMLVNMQVPDHDLASQTSQIEGHHVKSSAPSSTMGSLGVDDAQQQQQQQLCVNNDEVYNPEIPSSLHEATSTDPDDNAALEKDAAMGDEQEAISGHGAESSHSHEETASESDGGTLYSNHFQFLFIQVAAFTAGLIGGFLGMGGAIVVSPTLLQLGVHPQIVAATSGTLVLFSSSTALVAYGANGMLNLPYAGVFALANMVGALIGTFGIGGIIKKTGRVSLVVLSLAALNVVGGGTVLAFGILDIVQAAKSGHVGLQPLCS